MTSILYGEESTALSGKRARAAFLAEEGIAAVTNMRDDDFSNLTDGTHSLSTAGSQWRFLGGSDIIDIFTREIIISTIDSDTKQIVSQVTWDQNLQRTGTVSLTTYLTDWNKVVQPPLVGWAGAHQESSLDISDTDDGWKIQVQGNYAYLIRLGGDPDFIIVDITDPALPSTLGTLNLTDTPENIVVSGNYAYIASRSNNQELQIVNISNPNSPSVVGTFNAAGNANGKGVFINGNNLYLVRTADNKNDELYVINVANPASPSELGSLDLGAAGYELVIIGNYAYVAAAHNSQELQVIDITDPSALSIIGSYDCTGNNNAVSIAGFGSTIVLGRDNGDVYLLNVTTPATPGLLGTYSDYTGDIQDISLGNGNDYAFLASIDNGAEFQLIDISTPAIPATVSILDLSDDLNGVAYHSALDRAFVVGDSNTEEFISIMPN